VDEKFIGLSRISLQDAKLARLAKLANLRKASKQHRQVLGEIRSEIFEARRELAQIEQQLLRIVQFPSTTPSLVTDKREDKQTRKLA
jgi:hypothetical protein